MANLTRWNPFAELEEMLDRYSRNTGYPRLGVRGGQQEVMRQGDWSPAVDISEDDEAYLIRAELPGVNRDDVKVQVNDGVLTLQGERKSEKEEKGKKVHRVERFYGNFMRSFTLPDNVDEENINADYKDGILTLKLPKSEKAKPRSIDVKVQ